jgi:hypothetical protein
MVVGNRWLNGWRSRAFTLRVMLPTNKHLLDEKARLNPDEATSLLEHWLSFIGSEVFLERWGW